jgi:hypothetical protein
MERQPVALAIEDDGPKAVRADLVPRLEHLAAIGLDYRDRLIEPPLRIEIDQQTAIRRLLLFLDKQTSAHVGIVAGQKPDRHARILLFRDGSAEHGRVETAGTIEVQHRNINPDNLIGHDICSQEVHQRRRHARRRWQWNRSVTHSAGWNTYLLPAVAVAPMWLITDVW